MTITPTQRSHVSSLGPLMVDVQGYVLTPAEKKRLQNPLVGGVILFARNYKDRAQLTALTRSIHALRNPALLIAVDHEGGECSAFGQMVSQHSQRCASLASSG